MPSITLNFGRRHHGYNEHVSRHTGLPTGRPHIHRNHNHFRVFNEHISRHTGLPTGRPHIHRSYSFNPFAGGISSLSLGATAAITGIALLALGIAFLNPVFIAGGAALALVGLVSTVAGGCFLHYALNQKKSAADEKTPPQVQNEPNVSK